MSSNLTRECLSQYFYYDETSPSYLRWKVGPTLKDGRATKVKAGDKAGVLSGGKEKRCGSWKVKLNYRIYLVHRVIYILTVGDIPEGCVVDHIDGDSSNNQVSNLRVVENKVNSRNQRIYNTNKTGVGGVFMCSGASANCPYYRAVWHDLDGKQRTKNFAISKYGEEESFRLACEYRVKMIAELNSQGAGYTDRHGKE